jgi:tryptophan 2,3-dioxygenase
MELSQDILDRIQKLKEKYDNMGQDLVSYLDGLLYSEYLTYWDYIHLDTLLSLQNPRTAFPDENIFIMYHQVTELYFKMILSECDQICAKANITEKFFHERMTRINRYFELLTNSFDVMVDGMEKEQFLKYRMALLPASGFQSAQYRMIEIFATDFINLVDKDVREDFKKEKFDADKFLANIYWKHGATELSTGKKTLTLLQFEEKYLSTFSKLANERYENNIYTVYKKLNSVSTEIKEDLRRFDINVNVNWPLVHYKSAVRYLHKDPADIKATGGTNWQKYLPPRFQKRIFYPELWNSQEIEEWGKAWVENTLKEQK